MQDQTTRTKARWLEASKRVRLLSGEWLHDLEVAILAEVGAEKRRYWGAADISKNIFRDVVSQLSVLYDSEGAVTHENSDAVQALHDRLAMFWPFMREHQKFVEGLRECLLKVDMVPTDNPDKNADQWKPIFSTVTPDLYDLEFDPRNPTKITKVKHWVERKVGDKVVWTVDVWSLKESDAPYSIFDEEGNDVSNRFLDADQKKGWFDDNGRYLPFVHYHAAINGKNWNTFHGSELVCMTYKVGVFWTYWGHILKDCSYPARWGLNARLVGTASDEATGTEYVTSDPNVFMSFKTHGNNPGAIGQFNPGGDPKVVGESIIMYTAEGLNSWGIAPAENMRPTADPRSGFAIALSRETIREHQAKATPAFRLADTQTFSLIARLSNEADALDLPITGYGVTYRGIPPSAQEQAGKLDHDKKRVELKQTSYAELLAEDTGMSVEAAQLELLNKQARNNALGAPNIDAPAGTAASGIVKDVHANLLPMEGGVSLLMQFYNLTKETATAMLAGALKAPEPAVAPAADDAEAAPTDGAEE